MARKSEQKPEGAAEPREIVLVCEAALGCGTRPAGFVFGIVDGDEIERAEGVSELEFENALSNPQLLRP